MAETLESMLQRGYRYAYALTCDAVRAEDLLQEAWSRVLEADGPRTTPYLFRVMRNCFIDTERRARVVRFEPLNAELIAGHCALPSGDRQRVFEAIAQLRTEEREAIFLCSVEGYTADEVAQRTGKPRGTVLSLIHRGRGRLRQLLGMSEQEVLP